MLRPSSLVSAAVLAAILACAALAAHTHLATPSTWKLNLAESKFGDGPSMKSDTFVMITDNEKRAKYTDVMVDGNGKSWKTSWSGPADGTAKPITGMPGGSFSTNAATDHSVYTWPDGSSFACDFSVSPDKKKFLETCAAKTKDGKESTQSLVYDRIK